MTRTISRAALDASLPKGELWAIPPGSNFDKLMESIGDILEVDRAFMANLSNIRNAQLTTMLADLEREYGLDQGTTLTEQERRDRLEAIITAGSGDGTGDFMQTKLQAAGFALNVYQNDPPSDPATVLTTGILVVNGDIFEREITYLTVCGNELSLMGKTGAMFGNFSGINEDPVVYTIPVSSDYWPLIFYVGGTATIGGGGEITAVALVNIPAERREELIRLIVRYKPIWSWAVVQVTFV